MNRQELSAISEWALDRANPDNLDQLAEELRDLLHPDTRTLTKLPTSAAAADGLPSPHISSSSGLEQLQDAVCLLLKRYLSPAAEGDTVLLSSLLTLGTELNMAGTREVVAGLLVGGHYQGVDGPAGPMERQMLAVLKATARDDMERESLMGQLQQLVDAQLPAEHQSVSLSSEDEGEDAGTGVQLTGEQVPQVNDPDQVFAFIEAVKEGVSDRREYSRLARISIRQADFIARAASSLGLIKNLPGGRYDITESGSGMPAVSDPAGREVRHRVVGGHPLLKVLGLQMTDTLPTVPQLETLLAQHTALGAGTIRRRAQALRRWVEWWASGGR